MTFSLRTDKHFWTLFLLTAIGTIGLDYFFHTTFTPAAQMETAYYFLVIKPLVIFVVLQALFYFGFSERNKIIGAVAFSALLSLYYRGYELFQSLPFGYRAPDIVFGATTITLGNIYLFATIWFMAHAVFFYIALYVAKKIKL